jgi:PAS domain S-box-containing protein/putative nucleotidyltransferase with HDIG domain
MAGRVGKKGAANSEVKPTGKKGGAAKAVMSRAVTEQPEAKRRIVKSVGKTDSLQKPGTGKLVHELQVRQAELETQNEGLRRAQQQSQASQERYFDLYDIAPVGYFSISEKGIILEVNITGANLLGSVPGDMRAQRFFNFIFEEDLDIYYQHRSQLFETMLPQACEMRMVRKDGALVWVLVEAIVAKDARSGKPVCLATMSDVTRQKKAEEALRNERNLAQNYLDTVQTIIVALDIEGRITTINRKGCRLFGFTEDELRGQLWFSTCLPQPDGLEKVYPVFLKLISGELEAVEYFENAVVTRSGEIRQIAWHNSLLRDEKGRITGTLSSGDDITEHKNMEEALQQSEALYRLLAEHTTDTVWLMDMNLKLTYHSPSAEKLRGFTSQEIVELPLERHVAPESLKLLAGVLFEELPSVKANPDYNPVRIFEVEMFCKDGTTTWREIKLSVIRDPDGKPVSFLGEARDITERRKAEEALKASEAQYRLLADNTADGIWLLDMDLKLIYCSPSSERQSGFTLQEIMQMPLEQYFTPESLKVVAEAFLEDIPKAEADPDYNPIITLDLEFYKKDGTVFWAESKFSVIRDNCGKPVSILGVARDITERKMTEAAIHESEEKYRSLVETAIAGIASIDIEGKFMFANDTVCLWAGLNKADILGQPFADFLHPDDLPGLMEMFLNAARNEVPGPTIEFKIVRRDGRVLWLHTIPTPIILDGKTIGFNTILHDITERKQADDALKASEAQYRLLSEHMTDTVWLMDMNLKTTYQSPSVQRVRGFTPNEIEEMPLAKHLTPESLKIATDVFLEEMAKIEADTAYNFTRILELEFYRKDGSIFWSENTFSLIRDENGRPLSILGEGRDITDRKLLEESLREIDNLLEHTQEISRLGGWEYNVATKRTKWTKEVYRIYGVGEDYDPNNINGDISFYAPESAPVMERAFSRSLEEGEPYDLELEFIRANGEHIWVRTIGKPDIVNGKVIRVAGNILDITDKKRAEQALQESEAQYRLLSEHISDTVWLMDMNLNITYHSPSVEKLRGFTAQEIIGMPLDKHVTPESLKLAADVFLNELPKVEADENYNPVLTLELEYTCKDGTTVWLENKFSVIRDENGKPVSILGEARDMTERKKADELLRKSEAQYRLLSEHMTDTIRLMDMNLKTTYLSPSAEKQRGFTHQEILELPLEKQLAPESLRLAIEIFSEELPRVKADPDYNPVHTLDLEYICKDGTTVWAESKFSVIRDENSEPVSILAEARDITERRLAEDKLAKSYASLKKTLDDAINTMVKIVELRDPYTAGHQQKVAELATAIAREMKLEDSRIEQLRMAAVTHDIGKMYVPSDILSKPGRLSNIEFGLIKTHSQSGYAIVKGMDFPCSVADAVLQHHERLDGSGYPGGLKGEDTILEAKILAVADVIEAMASHRPYRPALGIDKALEEISENKGSLYDPDVVDACLELFNSGKFEFKPV